MFDFCDLCLMLSAVGILAYLITKKDERVPSSINIVLYVFDAIALYTYLYGVWWRDDDLVFRMICSAILIFVWLGIPILDPLPDEQQQQQQQQRAADS